MSLWYQQPSAFTSNPITTRQWGFSAIPNVTRSPFSNADDPSTAKFANAMYGLMPDYTRPYGGEEAGQNLAQTTLPPTNTGISPEYTECT